MPSPVAPEDCPTPEYHETHYYCPSCTWVDPEKAEEARRPHPDPQTQIILNAIGVMEENLLAAILTRVGPSPAVRAILSIKEQSVPSKINVDTVNEVLVLTFVDSHNDPTDAPNQADGTPAVLAAASDNAAVATVGTFVANPDGSKSLVAAITPVAVGTANFSATVDDTAGVAVPLPAPVAGGPQTFNDELVAVAVEVDPGAPAGARLSTSPA